MAPENLVEIENIGQSKNATALFLATLTLLGSTIEARRNGAVR
jgi:hypothetical protein